MDEAATAPLLSQNYNGGKSKTNIAMTQFPTKTSNKKQSYLPKSYDPLDTDILCGRGKLYSRHPANCTFSEAIKSNLQQYIDAPKRIDKSIVVSNVVNKLRESGLRFVKQDKTSKQWFVLSDDATHEKCGHAIRDLLKVLEAQGDNRITSKTSTKGCKKNQSSRKRKTPPREGIVKPRNGDSCSSLARPEADGGGEERTTTNKSFPPLPDAAASSISSCHSIMSYPQQMRSTVRGPLRYGKRQGCPILDVAKHQQQNPNSIVDAVLNLSEEYCGTFDPAHPGTAFTMNIFFSDPVISSQLLDALSDEVDGEGGDAPFSSYSSAYAFGDSSIQYEEKLVTEEGGTEEPLPLGLPETGAEQEMVDLFESYDADMVMNLLG